MKHLLFLLSFFAILTLKGQTIVAFTTPGPQTWVCPPNVSQITVQCWGGGGGGGNSNNNFLNGGCGGGGGAFSQKSFIVTPGVTYFFNVGSGGMGAPSNSVSSALNGGDSWFNTINAVPTSNNAVLAKGGSKGLNNYNSTYPNNGGQASLCYGDISFSGGSGNVGLSNGGGGGGGSAAFNSIGSSSTNSTIPGMANWCCGLSANGGYGSTTGNGLAGGIHGGGGGGSDDVPTYQGGIGGVGQVRISYYLNCSGTPITPIIHSNSTFGCGSFCSGLL